MIQSSIFSFQRQTSAGMCSRSKCIFGVSSNKEHKPYIYKYTYHVYIYIYVYIIHLKAKLDLKDFKIMLPKKRSSANRFCSNLERI